MKIKISADSTCDLSPELIERYHIGITPLYIIRGEETLRDGIDVHPQELYEYANATGKLCKTAAVNVSDYLAYFAACREKYDALIPNTNTTNNSCISQHTSIPTKQITHGRCSALVAMSANLLHLKPCIELKEGKMGVGRKYRGKLEKCYVQYIEDRLKGRDDIDCHRIFITDSGIDEATWRELERGVRACQPFEEVIHTQAGCTVSNHCGPGCMGILYYHK